MSVVEQIQRREPRLRSRGEVTICCGGMPELPATLHDMSISGLGLVAGCSLPEGSPVRIEIHGHSADGVVRNCRPAGDEFHIGISLGDDPQT